jgi:hypothetical protein
MESVTMMIGCQIYFILFYKTNFSFVDNCFMKLFIHHSCKGYVFVLEIVNFLFIQTLLLYETVYSSFIDRPFIVSTQTSSRWSRTRWWWPPELQFSSTSFSGLFCTEFARLESKILNCFASVCQVRVEDFELSCTEFAMFELKIFIFGL